MLRQTEVTKLEASQTQTTAKVVAHGKPESAAFAKPVTWVSRGAIQPGVDDFMMLWSLFRTFLPQVGWLVLMLTPRMEFWRHEPDNRGARFPRTGDKCHRDNW
jgi:hypothetical protein